MQTVNLLASHASAPPYADKQKVQDLISQQRINLADVKYLGLDRARIILNSFVNPQAEISQSAIAARVVGDGGSGMV